MTDPAPNPSGLKTGSLSFWEVVAQSVSNIAPSATPAFIIPLVFASSRQGTWLAYVVATLALLFVSFHINQFARRDSSPGALYSFVARGMGPRWGQLCGWSLILAYLFTASATMAGLANYCTVLAHMASVHTSDLWVAAVSMVVSTGLAWWIAYSDVQLSARAMLVLEFASLSLILWLAATFLFHVHFKADPTQLDFSHMSLSGILRGLVLAFFSFVGFESATALGHESRDPLRVIPRSVILSVIAVGAIFVFISYVLVAAFQYQSTPLDRSNAPLTVLANVSGLPYFAALIAVGAIISFFACILASINAAARVLFWMGRHGLFHAALSSTHAGNRTPHVAVSVLSAFGLALTLAMLFAGMPIVEIFGELGSLATFGFLLSYILVSLASPLMLHRARQLSFAAVVAGVLSLSLLGFTVFGSLYPLPDPPGRYLPLIFAVLMLMGVAWFAVAMARMRKTSPAKVGSHADSQP